MTGVQRSHLTQAGVSGDFLEKGEPKPVRGIRSSPGNVGDRAVFPDEEAAG